MSAREDRLALAGDYVLGLLDEAEQRAVEAGMTTDAELRGMVLSLAARMQALDADLPETVPDTLWGGIAARIDATPQAFLPEHAEAGAANVIPLRRAEAATRPHDRSRPADRRPWLGMAVAAGLLASVGAGYVGGRLTAPQAEPVVVVVLAGEDNLPRAVVEAYADDAVRIVPLADLPVPAGKTLEVWTLYDRAVGPVSLGTIDKARAVTLRGPDLPRPQADQLYEITLEDAPRSAVGRPTGPILAKGLAVRPPM